MEERKLQSRKQQQTSTRLMVRNLPKHLDERRLREHFSSQGEVTDSKVCRTQEGQSRQFGFIGFKTVSEARRAKGYLNNTFIDTSRITVEEARGLDDQKASGERPWSKYSEGSSAKAKRDGVDPREAAKRRRQAAPGADGDGGDGDGDGDGDDDETAAGPEGETARLLKMYREADQNPELREFLEVMQPKAKGKIWSNHDQATLQSVKGKVSVSSVPNRKRGGEGKEVHKLHVKFDDEESDDEYDNVIPAAAPPAEVKAPEPELSKPAFDEKVDDLEWLKSKAVSGSSAEGLRADSDSDSSSSDDDSDADDSDDDDSDDDGGTAEKAGVVTGRNDEVPKDDGNASDTTDGSTESSDSDDDDDDDDAQKKAAPVTVQRETTDDVDVSETGRLFVTNLPYVATEEEVTGFFQQYGSIAELHMPLDKETKRPKGYCFVMYVLPQDALNALAAHGEIFQGRLLNVTPARDRPAPKEDEDEKGDTFKSKRKKDQQAAAKSDHNWNSLFLQSNAVADAVAAQYDVDKSSLLGKEATGNLAVRMALGETHVVGETRQAMEQAGVAPVGDGVAAGSKQERSKTAFLLKNIPFSTTEAELMDLCAGFGTIARLVLPPIKTLAIVEYLEASEARRAFRALAYKKFKHMPLFLEWAPLAAVEAASQAKNAVASSQGKKKGGGDTGAEAVEVDGDERTLFVKNLSFSTKEKGLKAFFAQCGRVKSVSIPKKPSGKGGRSDKEDEKSMGFGFVEYGTREETQKALRKLQGMDLDGHQLRIAVSKGAAGTDTDRKPQRARQDGQGRAKKKAESAKLLMRNVPFEATKSELRQLFSTFGQLKSVRLPKKFDHTHRGFAFIEFLTKQEALNAYNSLRSSHFYGRHVVLEFAEASASLADLQQKTERQHERSKTAEQNVAAESKRARFADEARSQHSM